VANPTPKNTSTRVQLPVGPSGTEPPNAPEGGLAYANDTEVVRVKTSTGWEDVAGGGGGGTITEIVEGPGIDITGGTGPIVTVGVDTNPATSPFVLKDITGAYPHDSTPSRDDHVYLQDTVDGSAKQSRVRELPVIEKDFSVYTFLAPSVNSDIVYNINGSPGAVRTCNLGDIASAGQVTGTLSATKVVGITETSGPTALAIGPINDFQLLQRVGSTVVGTAYPPTTLAGDVNGPMTSNQVNAIHETSGPTQLTIGAISDGQVLVRSGTAVVGSTPIAPSGNPYIDPPLVANAFDDEFNTGSADLATRGYIVKNSAGTTLVRSGPVDAWSSVGPGAGTYWSTIVGSQILIQLPVIASSYFIGKSISLASGDTYFTRIGTSQRFDSAVANSNFTDIGFYGNSGGVPDLNNRVYISEYSGNGTTPLIDISRITGGVQTVTNRTPPGVPVSDIRGIRWLSGTTYSPFITNSGSGDTLTANTTGGLANTSVAYFGILFTIATGFAGTVPQILSVDFFRKTTSSAWIAQAPRPVAWNVVNADISTYSPKSAPVAADQIYIADSGASNAIKRTNVSSIFTGLASVYLTPPANPDPFNDEFMDGSPDLAVRGWTIVNSSTGATCTRVGDVDTTIAVTSIAVNTYRSTIVGSCLLIQISSLSDMVMYKAATGSMQIAVSATFPSFFNTPSNGQQAYAIIANSTPPTVAASGTARMLFSGIQGLNMIALRMDPGPAFTTEVTTAYLAGTAPGFTGIQGSTLFTVDHNDTTKVHNTNPVDSNSLRIYAGSSVTTAGFVSATAGMYLTMLNSGIKYCAIDFIRRYPSGKWFGI